MANTPNPGFQSKFKFNEQLRRCAVNDVDHFGEKFPGGRDQFGLHVGLVHQALNAWAARQKPPVPAGLLESDDALFDRPTSELLTRFKTVSKILNLQGKIDRIVGKKTVRALNKELPAVPDVEPPPNGGLVLPTNVKFRDVIFVISAIGHRREINSTGLLAAFVRSRVTTVAYLEKFDRALDIHAVFRRDNMVFDATLANLKAKPLAGQKLGIVMMYGVSQGGVLITELAKKISGGNISIEYVGVSDGAFFDRDTTNVPTIFPPSPIPGGKPSNIPSIQPGFANFLSKRKVNVFQTKGNGFKSINPLNNPQHKDVMWFSDMAGGEVHGEIPGFVNRRVDDQMTGTNADELHGDAARLGEDQMLVDMRNILANA